MDSRKMVAVQTIVVSAGQAVGLALMCGVFALLHRFSLPVLWGGIVGSLLSILNFFIMAVSASLAADKAEKQDVQGGQKLMRLSYLGRIIGLFAILFICVKSGYFNLFSLLIPLLFARPSLTLYEFFRKPGDKKE